MPAGSGLVMIFASGPSGSAGRMGTEWDLKLGRVWRTVGGDFNKRGGGIVIACPGRGRSVGGWKWIHVWHIVPRGLFGQTIHRISRPQPGSPCTVTQCMVRRAMKRLRWYSTAENREGSCRARGRWFHLTFRIFPFQQRRRGPFSRSLRARSLTRTAYIPTSAAAPHRHISPLHSGCGLHFLFSTHQCTALYVHHQPPKSKRFSVRCQPLKNFKELFSGTEKERQAFSNCPPERLLGKCWWPLFRRRSFFSTAWSVLSEGRMYWRSLIAEGSDFLSPRFRQRKFPGTASDWLIDWLIL